MAGTGGKYATQVINGKAVVDPSSFQTICQSSARFCRLDVTIRGFVEAQIIGFVLIVGGAFAVLQKTKAIDSMIKPVAKAHTHSRLVRVMIYPCLCHFVFAGGASFGMAEEAIPFVMIFIPLALALGYDSITGVAIPLSV